MNELIKSYGENQLYPCLVFFLKHNPKFGKTFTIDDVEKPSEELYDYISCDYATLGRPIPPYEEWAKKCHEGILASLITSAKCALTLEKSAVESFDDIGEIKKIYGFVRYAESGLNEHFGV
jgi:hypothetical protein